MTQRDSRLVESPCVGKCDSHYGPSCTGCGRTTEEVLNWSKMEVDERRRTLTLCRLRLKKGNA